MPRAPHILLDTPSHVRARNRGRRIPVVEGCVKILTSARFATITAAERHGPNVPQHHPSPQRPAQPAGVPSTRECVWQLWAAAVVVWWHAPRRCAQPQFPALYEPEFMHPLPRNFKAHEAKFPFVLPHLAIGSQLEAACEACAARNVLSVKRCPCQSAAASGPGCRPRAWPWPPRTPQSISHAPACAASALPSVDRTRRWLQSGRLHPQLWKT